MIEGRANNINSQQSVHTALEPRALIRSYPGLRIQQARISAAGPAVKCQMHLTICELCLLVLAQVGQPEWSFFQLG